VKGTFIGMSESRRGIINGAETATSVPCDPRKNRRTIRPAANIHTCCCMPLLLHAPPLLLDLLCSLLLAMLCSLLLSLRAPSGSRIGSLPKLCCSLLEFSPHTRGTCLRQGRKTKDTSRSVTCAAGCLGCVSLYNRFWSRAKSIIVVVLSDFYERTARADNG